MKVANRLLIATAVSGLLVSNIFADENLVKQGEKIFTTNTKGNCIACHAISGKTLDGPGSFGPELTGLAYWPEEELFKMVYNPYDSKGKITAMPAFGKSGWLSDDEIKAVVAFLKTIN
ncbi:MAG: sulfur oxidation c-type cytochrome SoxX [Arcobacteraceae bacterium]|jgi:sulfur-oxidizing protein SoxX|nr:sulfur oxidation c-type cytochrome SoxX [Arcobacteraceae bacterium]